MAGTIKGITIEIAGNTQPLNKALEGVNKKTRDLQGELKSVDRLLKLDPKNTELLAQKQKLLADQVDNSREKLNRLKAAQEQVNQAFQRGDLGEEQYRHFQRQVINAEQDLKKFEQQLKDVNSTAKKLDVDIKGIGNSLKGFGQTMSVGVTAPIVGGFFAVTEGTKELRSDLARLEANAQQAGQEMGVLNDAMATLNAVTGETDSSVEGLSNLMATGFRDEQLTELLDSLYGASIKFSDTLKFEGIADGLQETLATGQAIGPFAELLERSGVKLDTFNAGLQEAISKGEQENYVLETLAKTGLAETYEAYRKNNEEMVKAEEANFRMQEAFAKLGAKLEPILTPIIGKITELVNKFNEMSPAGQKIVLVIAGIAAAIGPLLVVIGSLMMVLPALGAAIGAISLPVVAVIAGIAALIAIGMLLVKNWEGIKIAAEEIWVSIKDFFVGIWEDLKAGWISGIDGIKTAWTDFAQTTRTTWENMWNSIITLMAETWDKINVLVAGALNNMLITIVNVLNGIKISITNVFNGIKAFVFNGLNEMLNSVISIWNNLKFATSDVWNSIKNTIKNAINGVIGYINKLINAWNKIEFRIPKVTVPFVGTFGGFSVGVAKIPKIPMLATGGVVTDPTLAMIGEDGDEAIIPLAKLKPMLAEALRDAILNTVGRGNQSASITIVNQGTVVGSRGMEEFAETVGKTLSRKYGLSIGGAY